LSYSVDFSVKIITGVPKYRYKKRYEIWDTISKNNPLVKNENMLFFTLKS
jgi:hypothetical protein